MYKPNGPLYDFEYQNPLFSNLPYMDQQSANAEFTETLIS
jgi:hypothetical protein